MTGNRATVTQPERAIRTVALTALAGSSIEWYDFFLYGTAAALVFPDVFFPPQLPPLVGLLASFSSFAVGFLSRPIGGVIFGHFGDRVGRKRALVIALVAMGGATTLIGLLPSYATAGAAAPVMLMILRFAQGLAMGGQWGGAVLLATESAPRHKRGFYGSFAQVGAPVGVVLANLVLLVVTANVSDDAFMSWGWRVPFLLSVTLIGLALYVQLRLEDTPAFRQLLQIKEQRDAQVIRARAQARGVSREQIMAEMAAERRPSPVIEALQTYPRTITLAAGSFMASQVGYYILIAFMVAYGTSAPPAGLGLPRGTMLAAVLIGAVVMIPALLIAAALTDKYGRRGIYMAGAALLGVWAFIMFALVGTKSFLWITVAISVGQVLVAMMYGPQAAFFAEMFTTRVRYSGASLGYQSGTIIGAALAPIIATLLLAQFGNTFWISVYIAAACAITIASTLLLKETYQADLEVDVEPDVAAAGAPAQPSILASEG